MIFLCTFLVAPPVFWAGIALAIFKGDAGQEMDEQQIGVEFCIPTLTRTRTPEWQ